MKYSLILIFINLIIINSFKCGHNLVKDSELKQINIINPNSSIRKLDETTHSLSIFVDYEILKNQVNQNIITQTYYEKIEESLNNVVDLLSKLLSINSTKSIYINSNLFSNPSSSDYIIFQNEINEIINKNINSDLVVIPKITNFSNNIDAIAKPIGIDSNTKRPIIGSIFLSSKYPFYKVNSIEYLTMILLHEITHILCFSRNLFDYFSTPPKFIEKEINGIKKTLLSTPKVIKQAKRHFSCDKIEGIELENQGSSESIGSHWDSRIMLGDYMTAGEYNEMVISEITLALFEDSGWYNVNYYTGGLFRFGKGLGCDFLNDKCINGNYTKFGREFCLNKDENKCSASNLNRGSCYIKEYNYYLDNEYQYFNNNHLGGFFYADYCPVSFYYDDVNGYFFTKCNKQGKNYNSYTNYLEEIYGENSICVLSSLINKKYPNGLNKYDDEIRGMCYEVLCDFNTKSFLINVGYGGFVNCTGKYSQVEVINFYGVIICPDFNTVCTGSYFCNDPIDCINLKSVYYDDNTSVENVENYKIEVNSGKSVFFYFGNVVFVVLFLVF